MYNRDGYAAIRSQILDEIDQYAQKHQSVGGFLMALLSNDLKLAVMQADPENLITLKDLVMYVYWEIPSVCHGSKKIVEKWLNKQEDAKSSL